MMPLAYIGPLDDDWAVLSASPAFRRVCRGNGYVIRAAEPPWDKIDAHALLVRAEMLPALADTLELEHWPWILIASDRRDAADALRLGATDLLLHPLSSADLERALNRIGRRFRLRSVEPTNAAGSDEQALDVPLTKGRRVALRPAHILYLEAQGDLTHLHMAHGASGKLASIRNIGSWEEYLPRERFVRIHKKYIVNLTYVDNLSHEGLHLAQNLLPIAKRRRRDVEKMYHTFQVGAGPEV